MFNRKHIAIITLAAASVSTGALAGGESAQPEQFLQEARGFGAPNITGQASGDRRDAHRVTRVDDENLNRSERLWCEMARSSEGN